MSLGAGEEGNKHLPMKHCSQRHGSTPLPVGYIAHNPQESCLTSTQKWPPGGQCSFTADPRAGIP